MSSAVGFRDAKINDQRVGVAWDRHRVNSSVWFSAECLDFLGPNKGQFKQLHIHSSIVNVRLISDRKRCWKLGSIVFVLFVPVTPKAPRCFTNMITCWINTGSRGVGQTGNGKREEQKALSPSDIDRYAGRPNQQHGLHSSKSEKHLVPAALLCSGWNQWNLSALVWWGC